MIMIISRLCGANVSAVAVCARATLYTTLLPPMPPPRPAGQPVGRTGARSHTCNRHRARARLLAAAAAAAGTRVFLRSADLHAAGFSQSARFPFAFHRFLVPETNPVRNTYPGEEADALCVHSYMCTSTKAVGENSQVE